LAWEKLVEVTRANEDFERGQLNAALKSIKSCCERDGIPGEDVPSIIELHARYYREAFPGLTLTPTALARHWYRVIPEAKGTPVEEIRRKYLDRD